MTLHASKGSGRRPESPRDVLTCDDKGHVWIGQRCFRCKARRPADTTPETQEER
jgi:hypothetical protein